jgi:hypothetical protein
MKSGRTIENSQIDGNALFTIAALIPALEEISEFKTSGANCKCHNKYRPNGPYLDR